MKKIPSNKEIEESKSLKSLEYALLVFCLGIIILRAIYTEGPTMRSTTISVTANDSLYSLYVSASLFFAFILWGTDER